MIKPIKISITHTIALLLMIAVIAFGAAGCKSKEKLVQQNAEKEYSKKVEKAKAELKNLLEDDGLIWLEEMERRLNVVKSENLIDPVVVELIKKVEAKIAKEHEKNRKENEESVKIKIEPIVTPEEQNRNLDRQFEEVAKARSTGMANKKIRETLKLFTSGKSPVLIIIYQDENSKDYDKPTTIREYLNYIKDQKKYNAKIQNINKDENGQIKDIELIKK